MKILIFLQGTLIMHKSASVKSRDERVKQVRNKEVSTLNYASYVPIGKAVEKLKSWQRQGAEILYLSSQETKEDLSKDKIILKKYGFPKGTVLYRKNGQTYQNIVEKIQPNVLIEDNCESIGGEKEMTITFVNSKIKSKIRSIIIKEFGGIDHLPDNPKELAI